MSKHFSRKRKPKPSRRKRTAKSERVSVRARSGLSYPVSGRLGRELAER
jgi:hypothetical protein